jgi:hypothetical protein
VRESRLVPHPRHTNAHAREEDRGEIPMVEFLLFHEGACGVRVASVKRKNVGINPGRGLGKRMILEA